MLIGGQAVALWAVLLGVADPHEPLASKDIDFAGDRDAARRAAEILGATAVFPKLGTGLVVTGIVRFVDSLDIERTIDFLPSPRGLRADDVTRTAQAVEIQDRAHGVIPLWIMHPERCMESKAVNAAEIGRTDEASLRQLRATIRATHAFMQRLLDEDEALGGEGVRAVLRLNERITDFAESRSGTFVQRELDIDVADALCVDPRLPNEFITRRLPQLRERLDRRL